MTSAIRTEIEVSQLTGRSAKEADPDTRDEADTGVTDGPHEEVGGPYAIADTVSGIRGEGRKRTAVRSTKHGVPSDAQTNEGGTRGTGCPREECS